MQPWYTTIWVLMHKSSFAAKAANKNKRGSTKLKNTLLKNAKYPSQKNKGGN